MHPLHVVLAAVIIMLVPAALRAVLQIFEMNEIAREDYEFAKWKARHAVAAR